ncbi:hypothetical protein Q2T40_05665 [Winogradskyella maritima]|nr:hypothetical protein [Winogradskyella maritima]
MALRYRDRYTGVTSEDHIKQIEKDKGDLVISTLNFENSKDTSKPVMLTYEYNSSDAIDNIGGNLYFSPLVFLTMNESPFKLDKRDYPIDFIMPLKINI